MLKTEILVLMRGKHSVADVVVALERAGMHSMYEFCGGSGFSDLYQHAAVYRQAAEICICPFELLTDPEGSYYKARLTTTQDKVEKWIQEICGLDNVDELVMEFMTGLNLSNCRIGLFALACINFTNRRALPDNRYDTIMRQKKSE